MSLRRAGRKAVEKLLAGVGFVPVKVGRKTLWALPSPLEAPPVRFEMAVLLRTQQVEGIRRRFRERYYPPAPRAEA